MRAKRMPYEFWLKAMDTLSQLELRDKQGRLLSAQAAESRVRTEIAKIEKDNKLHYTPEQKDMLVQFQLRNAALESDMKANALWQSDRDTMIKHQGDTSFFGELGRSAEYWLDKFRIFK